MDLHEGPGKQSQATQLAEAQGKKQIQKPQLHAYNMHAKTLSKPAADPSNSSSSNSGGQTSESSHSAYQEEVQEPAKKKFKKDKYKL